MSHTTNFLAFDLGAESGRAVIGRFDSQRLSLEEIHRFPNNPVRIHNSLHWNVLALFAEIKNGLSKAAHNEDDLASVGLDTWGVDFALLNRAGQLIENPYHYRDSRTDGILEKAFALVPQEEIFEETGLQFLQFNSLCQLLAMREAKSSVLEIAHTFLTMPDLFNYWLTGQKVCEFTNATTTQCYNPRQKIWANSLLQKLAIPTHIFPEIVPPGTTLGPATPAVTEEVGLKNLSVIAPACHDTGSAVAAIPATGTDFAWISSGTWSIMGVEVADAIVNEQALAANLTNEGGVSNTFRLSKNIMGLWLVQECRRAWAGQGQDYSYNELTQMATQSPSLQAIIDPDFIEFLKPGNMPARIRAYCQQTGQTEPEDEGAVICCALESLALKYRWVLERLEMLLGRRLGPIHIVGGGTRNKLLNQFTADATNRQVITGPVEATATGNIMMQAVSLGYIGSVNQGREIVRRSFEVMTYQPSGGAAWDDAYNRLLSLMG